MYHETVNVLSLIHMFPTDNHFPNWQELRIKHGFEGIGGASINADHLKQVHGVICLEASLATRWDSQDRPEGDAIFTAEAREVAVKTADCVPILIHTPEMVMAVHGGWRGLCSGIVQEAIKLTGVNNIKVGIGPCISAYSFEIGEEVRLELEQKLPIETDQKPWIFSKGVFDRWHSDLGLAALFVCVNLGVPPSAISIMKTCTKLNADQWHSYRRDGLESGRNWSWISR